MFLPKDCLACYTLPPCLSHRSGIYMRHKSYKLWTSLFISITTSSVALAETNIQSSHVEDSKNISTELHHLSNKLKVDANAAQPDDVKDPFEGFNRKVYVFNDFLDTHFLRPVAVQYSLKVPETVRGSYSQFRSNLNEPWNAVNQTIQWKPWVALKTLGRFAFNSLTTLGLADPATRLNLNNNDESLGTTLGYYGVPSGPYLMLPFFGPSTLRDGIGLVADRQAKLQRYIFEDSDQLYWSDAVLGAIDTRSSLLQLDSTLQGDKYAAIRDLYLQRKKFLISEKQGKADQDVSFVSDDSDTNSAQ